MTTSVVAERAEVERWLPHRGAMLLIDRVLSVGPKRVTGQMDVRADAFWADGHFPGAPVLPGVLQVEFAAQLGGVWVARRDPPPPPGTLGVFASIRRATFRRPVLPPTTLTGEVVVTEAGPTATTFRFTLTADREPVADGQFMVALTPVPTAPPLDATSPID